MIIFSIKPFLIGINKEISIESVKRKYKEISSFSLTDEIEFYEFSYKNESFIYASRKRKSIIPIFLGLRIKIPILDIIWCSDENLISKNWKLLCKTIFFQKFILGIFCFFNKDNIPVMNKFDYFINTKSFKKSILTFGIQDRKLIYSLGSEMMIF